MKVGFFVISIVRISIICVVIAEITVVINVIIIPINLLSLLLLTIIPMIMIMLMVSTTIFISVSIYITRNIMSRRIVSVIYHIQKQPTITSIIPTAAVIVIRTAAIHMLLLLKLHLCAIRIILLLLLIQYLYYRPKYTRHLYLVLHTIFSQHLEYLIECYMLHAHVALFHVYD